MGDILINNAGIRKYRRFINAASQLPARRSTTPGPHKAPC
jgi:hypothetical protein